MPPDSFRPEGVCIVGPTYNVDVTDLLTFDGVDDADVALWSFPVTEDWYRDVIAGQASLTIEVLPPKTQVMAMPAFQPVVLDRPTVCEDCGFPFACGQCQRCGNRTYEFVYLPPDTVGALVNAVEHMRQAQPGLVRVNDVVDMLNNLERK